MNALLIALNGIRLTLQTRESVFWIFVGPLIFATFFGIVFKEQPPRPVTLEVVNQDTSGTIADELTATLEHDGIVITRANAVTPGRLAVVVPAGTSASIAAGKGVELPLYAGAEETRAEGNVRFKIVKALMASVLGIKATDAPGPLAIVKTDAGITARPVTAGFQRSVPSYMVMFVFLNLLVSGAGIADERRLGLLRRLAIAPVSRGEILLGKLLGRFAIGWMQIAWMLLAGRVLFHVQWAEHPWVFFGFLSLFALACASLGILFGTLFDDPDKCRALAVWTAILLAPLGGLWWPIEVVGPALRRVAHIVPTGWAMEPVNAMLAFGAGAREVAPFAAAFAALFVVTFALASRRFKPI
jgi:ABC-2 type transport system permease protein